MQTQIKSEQTSVKHSSAYLIKETSLGVLTTVLSVLSWFLLALVLKVDFFVDKLSSTTFNFSALWNIGLLVLVVSLWAAFFVITAALVKKKQILYLISLLNGLAVFIFFGFNFYSLIAFVLLLLILVHYAIKVYLETRRRIKFSLYLSMRHGLTWLVTVILIVVSLLYYHSYTQNDKQENSFRQSAINSTVSFTSSALEWQLPGYDPEMTLDDFIKILYGGSSLQNLDVESLGLSGGLAQDEVQKLLEQQLMRSGEMLEGEMLAQTRNEFLKSFKIEAEGTDSMDAVMSKILEQYIDKFVVPYEKYFPLIIVLSLFFALSIFNPLFVWLIKLFALLFFYILVWTGFAEKQKIQVEAERVDIKS